MKKVFRWAGIAIGIVFLGLQFIRPAKTNPATDASRDLLAQVEVPAEVAAVVKRACYDCHSNETRWPWYSQIAPVSWFVVDHVNHGRRHLNFSEWAQYPGKDQTRIFSEIRDTVRDGFMPLPSYTLVHKDAMLSDADKKLLGDWAKAEGTRLTQSPPAK